MWLITKQGFYSVVEAKDETLLVIRTRVRSDLENLRQQIPGLKIVEGGGTDYPYRAFVTPAQFSVAASELAEEIDYPNFKDAVKDAQGQKRANVYLRVWSALFELMPLGGGGGFLDR